jgi:hypothetical protein
MSKKLPTVIKDSRIDKEACFLAALSGGGVVCGWIVR